MCGLAGFIPGSSGHFDGDVIRGMLRSLAHRGPDDRGYLVLDGGELHRGREWSRQGEVAHPTLLHRRLSILDLRETGWQPMSTPDDRFHMVFNGEIYNYVELRDELGRLGHRFRSTSDSEVLLAAFAQWGVGMLPRLVGMFAFAVADVRSRSLWLVRDFFGIKPLFYAHDHRGFAFASEIKALLEIPGAPRQVNPQRLYDFLRYSAGDHGDETLFAGIRQVPPAHYLRVDLDSGSPCTPVRYWSVDLSQRAELSFDDAAAAVRDRFVDNVRLHMRSDVPLGAALSGGIDSSAIVSIMRRLEPTAELHAFSYVAEDDPSVNEERWSDMVSAASGMRVHKVRPSADDLIADLEALLRVQDEPFSGTSIYAQNRVFRAAGANGIKVMLDGQGADEILGGYRMYSAARLASLIRKRKPLEAWRFLRSVSRLPARRTFWLQSGQFLIPPALQGPFRAAVGEALVPDWLNGDWFAARGVQMRPLRRTAGDDVLREQLLATVESSLISLLRAEDRNSMAYSVESRVPFLTADFVQFVLSLPEEYLISPEGTTKSVFRQAMRGIVPDPILDRKDKIGFATPEQRWLLALSPWVDQIIGAEAARQIPALLHGEIVRQWNEIKLGRRRFDFRVWRWLSLVRWVERFDVALA